ncbi:GNAT family N-acetyltransferase [uncultured Croceitalea sp.]|uniref:GNAT family N-acetyltransferase n=1 Tax=uncultured Croceitalea sp. TaxID=1798908 RepID=UPI00330631B1
MSLNTNKIQILKFKEKHIPSVISLFKTNNNRELSYERMDRLIIKYPALVVFRGNELVGFAYTNRFAPDILELYNIFISPELRKKEIGSKLLIKLEEEAKKKYKGIILVNSLLYKESDINKKYATTFYLKNEYRMISETEFSKVFFKNLL